MLYIKTKKLTKKSRTYAACRGFFLYSTVKHPIHRDGEYGGTAKRVTFEAGDGDVTFILPDTV